MDQDKRVWAGSGCAHSEASVLEVKGSSDVSWPQLTDEEEDNKTRQM